MNYQCSRCGRPFLCEETISFCPFCGQAYALAAQSAISAPPSAAMSQRIVIGSDSERTVQDKYWRMTRASLESHMMALRRALPRFSPERESVEEDIPSRYAPVDLELRDFTQLRDCTSLQTFCKGMEEYLASLEEACEVGGAVLALAKEHREKYRQEEVARRLSMELGEWDEEELEDEFSVRVDDEEDFINQHCFALAEALGSMAPERLRPELDYDPEGIDWKEKLAEERNWDKLPDIAPYAALVKCVSEAAPVVLRVVGDNSLFVTASFVTAPEKKFSPKACAKELGELAARDYDPIFGDSPDELVECFSRAVVNITAFLNGLPDYEEVVNATPDKRRERMARILDRMKLDALYDFLGQWAGALNQELDRVYQGQTENMLDVYNAIDRLKQALDEGKDGGYGE